MLKLILLGVMILLLITLVWIVLLMIVGGRITFDGNIIKIEDYNEEDTH